MVVNWVVGAGGASHPQDRLQGGSNTWDNLETLKNVGGWMDGWFLLSGLGGAWWAGPTLGGQSSGVPVSPLFTVSLSGLQTSAAAPLIGSLWKPLDKT